MPGGGPAGNRIGGGGGGIPMPIPPGKALFLRA